MWVEPSPMVSSSTDIGRTPKQDPFAPCSVLRVRASDGNEIGGTSKMNKKVSTPEGSWRSSMSTFTRVAVRGAVFDSGAQQRVNYFTARPENQ